MINEYDRVKIIKTGDVGIVVDIQIGRAHV